MIGRRRPPSPDVKPQPLHKGHTSKTGFARKPAVFLNTSTRGRLEAAERGIRSARTHPGNGTTSDCGLTSGRHSTSTSEIPIEFTQHPTEHHLDTQAIKSSFRRRQIGESIHHAKYRYTSEPLLESVQEPFGHVDRQTDVVTAVLDEDRESDVSP